MPFFRKKIGLMLNKLTKINDGQYGLNLKVTDNNGNLFRNKHSIWVTNYGCIDMNLLEKDPTLFIYLSFYVVIVWFLTIKQMVAMFFLSFNM